MTEPVLLGADIGGTSTKVVVARSTCEVLSYASGSGGNINSSPDALPTIAATLEEATEGVPAVTAAHIGVAGAGPASLATVADALTQMWGARGGLSVSDDLATAFAASSPTGTGLLLLSGTGAVSAAFDRLEMVGRTDGMGWLLGDIGSGTWIGLEAMRAAAAALDARGEPTVLTDAVPAALAQVVSPTDVTDPRQRLISQAYSLSPRQYGLLAPVVVANIEDPVCSDILARARAGLHASARRCRPLVTGGDLVLTGGLLAPGGPLRAELVTDLSADPAMAGLTVVPKERMNPPILGALVLAAAGAGTSCDRDALARSLAEATPFT